MQVFRADSCNGLASACRCGELNHMARYCTAVKKEKKESGKAQDQERAVALLVHMEHGKEEGMDYVSVEEIRSC